MKDRMNSYHFLPWIFPVAIMTTWWMFSRNGWMPAYLLPHPEVICKSGYIYIFGITGDGPYAGRFVTDAAASLLRVVLGFSFATITGIPLGMLCGRMKWVDKLMSATIDGIRAVPGICWLPLALIWFGIGMNTAVFLIFLAAFFPIYLNAAAGTRSVPPILLQAGAMMGVSRIRGMFSILIPAAMSYLMTGLRMGLGISWAYLVLGELTGVSSGLGALIMDARMAGHIDIIMVGVMLIALLGKFSDVLLKCLLCFMFKSARRMP